MASHRIGARLSGLSPEQLVAFIDEQAPLWSAAALRVAEEHAARLVEQPEWVLSEVLLSPDLAPHILAQLPTKEHAAKGTSADNSRVARIGFHAWHALSDSVSLNLDAAGRVEAAAKEREKERAARDRERTKATAQARPEVAAAQKKRKAADDKKRAVVERLKSQKAQRARAPRRPSRGGGAGGLLSNVLVLGTGAAVYLGVLGDDSSTGEA
ncbi:hypothetical protein EMIHUDRAFT_448112 [Emiliania huxleyi CCMP1516]|uniref:Uncharacterized protein n=2 Tax=Emiliania huxleyi TaxID=2903 RepID=A0A0D3ITF2_EMIH1|nr:hypothetical protein EMIHUDRAFT_448112 [Emiliania huxleyi CCMP1516]EOD14537.1 hypothetical protein EMIHUDRAFT_448112 [Emiliania huxleyi CCMP1516]|eukprot:XP_005766966.1 hypothetical protein EMIHUDRAFT_448112 [Emiliania huxleyi CCMP1516]